MMGAAIFKTAMSVGIVTLLTAQLQAQEAVARFTAPNAGSGTQMLVRSTTDVAILEPILEAFVAANPDIEITYEQWGSNALYAHSRAACDGQVPVADAILSSGVHQMVDLVNRACARPHVSPATRMLPESLVWRDELWGITSEPAVIIYNTALVPPEDVPNSRFALLDLLRRPAETYLGKVATYDIEASGLGFLFAFMDSAEATTFGALLEGFSRTGAIATCCSAEIIDSVAEGHFLIAYNVLGSYVSAAPRQSVGVIQPEDYTLFLSRAYMIPKSAANADAAARLLEFLLSPAGRNILSERNLIQRPGPEESALSESARRFISIDPKLLVAMDQHRRQRFVGQWRTTFGGSAPP